jgi:hypothetical protein
VQCLTRLQLRRHLQMRYSVRRITSGEGAVLCEVRPRALQESPAAFASTFEAEAGWLASAWETDATRRAQRNNEATFLAVGDGQCVGLISAGRSGERPGVELFSM